MQRIYYLSIRKLVVGMAKFITIIIDHKEACCCTELKAREQSDIFQQKGIISATVIILYILKPKTLLLKLNIHILMQHEPY